MVTHMVTSAKIVHCAGDFKGERALQVYGVIPKSGNRFSEKIMPNLKMATGLIQQSWIKPYGRNPSKII
jgi:hypothetical protein